MVFFSKNCALKRVLHDLHFAAAGKLAPCQLLKSALYILVSIPVLLVNTETWEIVAKESGSRCHSIHQSTAQFETDHVFQANEKPGAGKRSLFSSTRLSDYSYTHVQ